MKHLTHILLPALLAALLIASCKGGSYRDVSIQSFEAHSLTPSGLKSASLEVGIGIHNPACYFRLKDISGAVRRDSTVILRLSVPDLEVAGHRDSVYRTTVTGVLGEGVSIRTLLPIVVGRDLESLRLDLSARAVTRVGIGKTVSYKDLSVKRIMEKKHRK